MRTATRLLVLTAVAIGLFATAAHGMDARPADACPAYGAALREARSALARGDRARALADLQRAKAALRACGRDEARKPTVVAALVRRS
jgi:hypothetical protein